MEKREILLGLRGTWVLRFVILTPGVANAHRSNEIIRDIFKVASPKCSLAKIKFNGRKGLSKPTTSADSRGRSGCRGPVAAAKSVSRRHGARDHQHFA
jgi:hypothetical protein